MKKILKTMIILVAFIFVPLKSFAMLEIDANGNPITKEIEDGTVTIMMEEDSSNKGCECSTPPDTGGTTSSSENSTGSEGTISNNAGDISISNPQPNDPQFYKTMSGKEVLEAARPEKRNDKLLQTSIIAGVIGIVLGILGTCFVLSRRK